MTKYKNKKNKQIEIAKKRIDKLFLLAEKNAKNSRFDLSDRYIKIARKIAMRYQIKINKDQKRKFCKHCYSYILPNINSRIRINRGKIIIFCKNCNKYTRILLK